MFGKAKLYSAIQESNAEAVKRLLELGVNPNKSILFFLGDSPLMEAIAVQSLEIVELLLKHNANPNQKGRYYYPIEFASLCYMDPVAYLNQRYPPSKDIEETAFRIVQLILESGVSIGRASQLLLPKAGYMGAIDLIEILVKYGANIDDLNRPDYFRIMPASLLIWLQIKGALPIEVLGYVFDLIADLEQRKKNNNIPENHKKFYDDVAQLAAFVKEKRLAPPKE